MTTIRLVMGSVLAPSRASPRSGRPGAGTYLGSRPDRPGDGGLLRDLGQLRALVFVDAVQSDQPVDPPGVPVFYDVGQLDIHASQRPALMFGVHSQRDRGAGTEPGQQQAERSRTGVGPAVVDRFVAAQRMAPRV